MFKNINICKKSWLAVRDNTIRTLSSRGWLNPVWSDILSSIFKQLYSKLDFCGRRTLENYARRKLLTALWDRTFYKETIFISSDSFHFASSCNLVDPSVVIRHIYPYWNMVNIGRIFILKRINWYYIICTWRLDSTQSLDYVSNKFLLVLTKITLCSTDSSLRYILYLLNL